MIRPIIASIVALAATFQISAFDLKDLLNGAGQGTETSGGNSGSNPLGALGSMISNVTASTEFQLEDLVGTWEYTSPAVSFASDNALQKIGGAAAATAVEQKLEPYYNTAGLTSTVITFDETHSFTMKLKVGSLKGTVEKADGGMLTFKFSALGKVPLGQVAAMATKSGNTLNLTFDVSRLIEVLETVNKVANNSSLSAVSSLLSSYDGIYAGFKLKRQ